VTNRLRLGLVLGLLLLSVCITSIRVAVAADAPARPKLAVVVVIDQFRGDYLQRWQTLFGKAGFQRLMTDGAWFQNCHYPYASTMTGPGHASISTGTSPYHHGIIMNEWYDRPTGKMVNCMENNRFQRIPNSRQADDDSAKTDDKTASDDDKRYGVAPDRLLSPTFADALKEQTNGRARVFSFSYKDRGAALPGGKQPDVCHWFDESTATVISSSYYRNFAPYALKLNEQAPANRYFNHPWIRALENVDYAKYSGADDCKGEGTGSSQGRTFPHAMNGGADKPKKNFYKAIYRSPFGNELLLELVSAAIEQEKLGTREVPDLLCVSFSSNDVIGHVWGPDSQEVMDCTVRTDDVIRRLLERLDSQVGAGNYVLALSADHGICPLPEVSSTQNHMAARVAPKTLDSALEKGLKAKFDPEGKGGTWIEKGYYPWVWLNQKLIRERKLKPADVEAAAAEILQQNGAIEAVFTRTQMLATDPSGKTDVLSMARRSFHPERSGDLYVVVKPYHLITSANTGTSHGTAHSYDTHVPLVVFGTNVQPGIHPERVVPQTIPAILATALGIKPPRDAEYPAPAGIFKPAN